MFDIDRSIINNVTPLCVIMEKYGSDKGSTRPSKHNYTQLYHSLFSGHVNSAMKLQRYIDTNLRVKMKIIPDCKWANVLYKISTRTPYAGQYA
jgi:hypothetical protein